MRLGSFRNLLLLAPLLCFACGGGGGGGGPTTPIDPDPPPTTSGITYIQDGPAISNSLALQAQSTAGTTLVLDLVATDVSDLYGVAFDLVFPANTLAFQGASEGSFLAGSQTSLQTSANGAILIVGYTRLGLVAGSSGSGVLMTLRFQSTSSGGGPLTFDNARAIDSSGREIAGLTWVSGDVTVNQ